MALHPKRNPREGMDEYGRSPLHYAALHGNLDEVKSLIANGADINMQDDGGMTPLQNILQGQGRKQNWVASNLGLAQSHFSEIVQGKKTFPIDKVRPLADLLGIAPEVILAAVDGRGMP